MPEDVEGYDTDDPEYRALRGKIRKSIETAANSQGYPGVVTQWLVIAELCSYEDERPMRCFWFDDAYHDDFGLTAWSRRGLLNEMQENLGL